MTDKVEIKVETKGRGLNRHGHGGIVGRDIRAFLNGNVHRLWAAVEAGSRSPAFVPQALAAADALWRTTSSIVSDAEKKHLVQQVIAMAEGSRDEEAFAACVAWLLKVYRSGSSRGRPRRNAVGE